MTKIPLKNGVEATLEKMDISSGYQAMVNVQNNTGLMRK
jgi:hypothetical protein